MDVDEFIVEVVYLYNIYLCNANNIIKILTIFTIVLNSDVYKP